LKKDDKTDKFPPLAKPEGFSLERQQCLFKEIWKFCRAGTEDYK